MTVSAKILHKKTLTTDRELHVRSVKVGSRTHFDVREYVPSLKRYGRGVVFNADSFRWLIEDAGPAVVDYMWPKGAPGPGQEKLV